MLFTHQAHHLVDDGYEVESVFRPVAEVRQWCLPAGQRLELSRGVRQGLAHVWTRWDGRGQPAIGGEAIALPARVALVAKLAEMFLRFGGRGAAVDVIRRRRGADLDPNVADAFLGAADWLLELSEAESVWDLALEAEPRPYRCLPSAKLDSIAAAFADFADLKSVFTLGHSAGVARLAEAAARTLGLSETEVVLCRRAGLVHDLGPVGLPNGIWEKRGPLTAGEWERVRLHPYYTERILVRAAVLQPLAQVAGLHHERRDGSGYHRGLGAAGLSVLARVLAAADAYHAMTEERPHRPARPPAEAAREVEASARAGGLDPEAVWAVVAAAGHARPRRIDWPAGLSDREVDVLRLVARGQTDKEIARALVISEVWSSRARSSAPTAALAARCCCSWPARPSRRRCCCVSRRSWLGFWQRFDALVCPVNAYAAPLHGTTFDDEHLPGFSYTMTFNLTGWPVVVVRAGTSVEGLPIGVQVVAPPWREDVALALARRIETAFDRRAQTQDSAQE